MDAFSSDAADFKGFLFADEDLKYMKGEILSLEVIWETSCQDRHIFAL